MKLISTIFGFVILSLFACKKSKVVFVAPACIQSNIDANKNKPDWGIRSVEQYQYQGMEVYVFQPEQNYSDAQTTIYRSDCTIYCTLGGITGNTICNGEKFSDKAIFIRTIWQK